jgi:site-specific recombinase XerC
MPKIISRDGSIRISGSIIHQVSELLRISTNNHQFGIKVSDLYAEGYTRQSNPYCRSFKTAKEYAGVWYQLATYVRETYGINKVTEIQPHHIESFIEQKADLSPKSLQNISSAIGKLENVIEQKLGIEVNFGDRELGTGRWLANKLAAEMESSSNRGAYENPQALVENLSSPIHQLVAELQWKGGLRIHETAGLRESSFWESGDTQGINVTGKGGYERSLELRPELYQQAKEVVQEWGRIPFDYKEYLADLRQSAWETGQVYQGSHGLRYNFAQERYNELISDGWGHHEALKQVSEELGHHRLEITLHYLGKGGGW